MRSKLAKLLSATVVASSVVAVMAVTSLAYSNNLLNANLVSSKTAWVDTGGGEWIYIKSNGSLAEGWQKIGGKWYYFEAHSGVMLRGWNNIGNKWYYLGKDGAMQKNTWVHDSDGWEYLNSNGNPVIGWKKIGKKWYYFDEYRFNCYLLWHEIDGKWYYFDKSGAMVANGWAPSFEDEDGDGNADAGYIDWFYMNGSGLPVKGWKQISKKWYYFDLKSGLMFRGWHEIGNKWYYFDNSGIMKTNAFVKDGDDGWSYVNASGNPVTGWKKVGSKWYYFDDHFLMLTGWQPIDKKLYYFYDSGAMAVNTTVDGVKINSSGEAVSGVSLKTMVDSVNLWSSGEGVSLYYDDNVYRVINADSLTSSLFFKKTVNDTIYYKIKLDEETVFTSDKEEINDSSYFVTIDNTIDSLYDGNYIKDGWLDIEFYDKNDEMIGSEGIRVVNDKNYNISSSFPWWRLEAFGWCDYDDTMESDGRYNSATETLAFSIRLEDSSDRSVYYAYYKVMPDGTVDYSNPLYTDYSSGYSYDDGYYYDFNYTDEDLESGTYLLSVAPTKKGLVNNPYFTAKCYVK